MIQRIQSIHLLLISFLIGFLIFGGQSFVDISGNDSQMNDTILKIGFKESWLQNIDGERSMIIPNSYLYYFSIICGILSFIAIFLFKNRKMQLLLCGFNFIFIILILFFMYYYVNKFSPLLANEIESSYKLIGVLPIFLIIFNALAMRGIYRDEILVKASDRLR